MTKSLSKDKRVVSTKIRKFAKGRACSIRIPGVCNGNPETTVWCHAPGGGMGAKQSDELGAFGCSSCHDAIDGRIPVDLRKQSVSLYFWEGHAESLKILRQNNLVTFA